MKKKRITNKRRKSLSTESNRSKGDWQPTLSVTNERIACELHHKALQGDDQQGDTDVRRKHDWLSFKQTLKILKRCNSQLYSCVIKFEQCPKSPIFFVNQSLYPFHSVQNAPTPGGAVTELSRLPHQLRWTSMHGYTHSYQDFKITKHVWI